MAHAAVHPGRVAQLVEQGIENPRVGGSIPSPATIEFHEKARLSKRAFSFSLFIDIAGRAVGHTQFNESSIAWTMHRSCAPLPT
jgi:hypothetical protein